MLNAAQRFINVVEGAERAKVVRSVEATKPPIASYPNAFVYTPYAVPGHPLREEQYGITEFSKRHN